MLNLISVGTCTVTASQAGKAKLTVELTWKDVAGSFTIQSPKDGTPVVD